MDVEPRGDLDRTEGRVPSTQPSNGAGGVSRKDPLPVARRGGGPAPSWGSAGLVRGFGIVALVLAGVGIIGVVLVAVDDGPLSMVLLGLSQVIWAGCVGVALLMLARRARHAGEAQLAEPADDLNQADRRHDDQAVHGERDQSG